MDDILDIGAEFQAMKDAEAGNWQPLADLVVNERPLGAAARTMIAAKLTGQIKSKRGAKADPKTAMKNKQLFLDFLHLRQTGQCVSDDKAYATIAARDNRSPDGVRKSVEAGRSLYPAWFLRILKDDGSY